MRGIHRQPPPSFVGCNRSVERHGRIAGVLGNPDAIITIHGGTHRDERRRLQAMFRSDPEIRVLVATDAAGEGVNLQNANLMVNYDLPWNPNRLEQRFGRIHRIGQTEVCHLWNLVAKETREGDVYHPRTKQLVLPKFLGGPQPTLAAEEDRRAVLANWLTAPENPYFSRAITNRVWANFFGVGLVENVDDLRLTNPPSNAELLDAAAKYLVDQKYDLKSLMRAILQSATYARSSQPLPENVDDARFYSRYYPRRLMAEVLLDALSQVSGSASNFGDYAANWRALLSYSPWFFQV